MIRPLLCPRCHHPSGDRFDMPAGREHLDQCADVTCGFTVIGDQRPVLFCRKCEKLMERRALEPHEPLPGPRYCLACAEADVLVIQGGVWWRCTDCFSEGAVPATEQLAIQARKILNQPAPAQVIVHIGSQVCPACRGLEEPL